VRSAPWSARHASAPRAGIGATRSRIRECVRMYTIHPAGGVIHNRPLMHPGPRATVGQVFQPARTACPYVFMLIRLSNHKSAAMTRTHSSAADTCHCSTDRCRLTAVKELNARSQREATPVLKGIFSRFGNWISARDRARDAYVLFAFFSWAERYSTGLALALDQNGVNIY
jgi:hypothetical protein